MRIEEILGQGRGTDVSAQRSPSACAEPTLFRGRRGCPSARRRLSFGSEFAVPCFGGDGAVGRGFGFGAAEKECARLPNVGAWHLCPLLMSAGVGYRMGFTR